MPILIQKIIHRIAQSDSLTDTICYLREEMKRKETMPEEMLSSSQTVLSW